MINRDELVAYINNLLSCASFNDYAPNGLQVEGSAAISRICTAVTASAEAIHTAALLKADVLLVHHGYFWRGESPLVTGMKRVRIGELIRNNMNLLAYHLPLDCHPQLGNNACIGQRLKLVNIQTHAVAGTPDLLWSAEFDQMQLPQELAKELQQVFSQAPLVLTGGDKPIKRLAWCSGGAHDFIEQAAQIGADAYLSGEVAERTYYQAQELGVHYFACGHHATERFGIQALGEHLAQQFELEHRFIDSNNPV